MTATAKFLAFDIGAESGRGVLGLFDGERLRLEDVHRFRNGPVRLLDSLHWDVLRLFSEMKRALALCARNHGSELTSIGVDTWGVDFALLDRDGELVGNPWHYRDQRTVSMMEEAFRRVPRQEIFEYTGIQFMPINTLYQLLAMRNSPQLAAAETLLMIPDLFNYWLTGHKVCEFTDATTTQFYDPRAKGWAKELLEKLGLPTHILSKIVPPGTVLGELLPAVATEVGLPNVQVIAPACHDTGSAVAAVPVKKSNYVYISSGTWSLMGTERTEPLINAKALTYNFTNEGGVCNTFRFLKNIMGLWLVQECRRIWAQAGEELSYSELTEMAQSAKPLVSIIEPDHVGFFNPEDMPQQIRFFCERTGQPVPADKGAVIRCALESLALKYRWVLERIEETQALPGQGSGAVAVHIVGGGAQNKLLCQLTANATGCPVIAGPVEATATGNILMQMLALGYVGSLEQARDVVRRSFEVLTYEPRNQSKWDEAYNRYLEVREQAELLL